MSLNIYIQSLSALGFCLLLFLFCFVFNDYSHYDALSPCVFYGFSLVAHIWKFTYVTPLLFGLTVCLSERDLSLGMLQIWDHYKIK